MLKKLSGAFTGGAFGAFIDSFNIWFLGKVGITTMLGIGLQPEFTPSWLYPRLVWGGIWALLLLIPVYEKRYLMRGMIFSLIPSAMMLFLVFPSMGKGVGGLGFGLLTPAIVVGLNLIYGMVASGWYRTSSR